MPFVSGVMLLDAPASALNNAGANPSARTDNAVATKIIATKQGAFPYVSAQAFRYWLRTTLQESEDIPWEAAPVYREAKVAYTDANPIIYWDDDLFGYMRAQGKSEAARARRAGDASRANETETVADITRVSPFRVSTFVAIAPMRPTDDFGTMSRHDGDPVPHEHQFYRTTLKGLFSLDLSRAGTFTYVDRTGFRNLDDVRKGLAVERGLEHLADEKAYRLPSGQRVERVMSLLRGLAVLDGGAKQALHYTDVTPAVILAAVLKGGNNPLQYAVEADSQGLPRVNEEALKEIVDVWRDQMLSPLYVGWVRGFHDQERARLASALKTLPLPKGYVFDHPRPVLNRLADGFNPEANPAWLT
jgi:CRISPR-associated protein Cst2